MENLLQDLLGEFMEDVKNWVQSRFAENLLQDLLVDLFHEIHFKATFGHVILVEDSVSTR